MATRLVQEIVYEAPAADVAAMLTDRSFREAVCRAVTATDYTVTIDGDVDAKEVVIDQWLPTEGVPSFAKKIVGETTNIVQTEKWTSATEGTMHVTIPGKPGQMVGGAVLVEKDGVTTETVTLDITVKIPLVSGKIEALIAKLLGSALRAEGRTGRKYLAGELDREA